MTREQVEELERASPIRRGVLVWFAVFGGIAAWTVHLMYVVSAEHWSHIDHRWSWTLDAATVVTALATLAAMVLSWRLVRAAGGADPEGHDDAGQLHFLGQLGLLVGAISLALIVVEGLYVHFLPRS